MTIEEALKIIKNGRIVAVVIRGNNEDETKFNQENIEALNVIMDTMHKYQKIQEIIKQLEREPYCNCIEFKRYAKEMGFVIEKQSIPYLMHKEMDIPISECQKAYDFAIDYLRSQGKLKG